MSVIKIDESEFTTNVPKEELNRIIKTAVNKAGQPIKLVEILEKEYNLKINKKRFADRLSKWINKNKNISLEIFLALCNFCNINYKINNIRLNKARINLNLNYPIELTKELAFVSELIKVEGHLTKRKIVIENTNTELTERLKKDLVKSGIQKENIIESLHIKIQVPEKILKDNIVIRNLSENKEIQNFHERILKLKKGNKKELIFTENKFEYDKEILYEIYYNQENFLVKVKIPRNDKIISESFFTDERYQKSCVSLKLEIWNKTLVYLLNKYFEIPYGEKSRLIKIPLFLKTAPNGVLKELINAVLAAESTVNYEGSRFISVTSLSNQYIKDLQEILLKFNIISHVSEKTLRITSVHNFRIIKQNFNFLIKKKNNHLDKLLIIETEQFPKNFAKVFYLKSLSELNEATMIQIRDNVKRTGNSFRTYVKELLNDGYIEVVRDSWPKVYALTEEGIGVLNRNKIYLY